MLIKDGTINLGNNMKYTLAFISIILGSVAQFLLKKGMNIITKESTNSIEIVKKRND